jgi:hypothetical protein
MNASIINSDSSNSVSGFIKTITDFSVKIYDYLLYGIPLATNEEDGKTIKSILQSNVDSRLLSSSDNYIQRQYEASNNTISRVVRNLMDARVQMILKSPNRKDISVNTFRCAILNEAYRPGKEHHKTVHNLLTVAAQKAEEEGANSEIYEMLNTLACLALGKGSIDFFKMIETFENDNFHINLDQSIYDPISKTKRTTLEHAQQGKHTEALNIITSRKSMNNLPEILAAPDQRPLTLSTPEPLSYETVTDLNHGNGNKYHDPKDGDITFFDPLLKDTSSKPDTDSVAERPQKNITRLFTPGTAAEMLQNMPRGGGDSGNALLRRALRGQ